MRLWSHLRTLLVAIACLGYLANGAQAHLSVSSGDTLDLMLCGTGSAKPVSLQLPGEPIEETEDTCCGDCAPNSVISVSSPHTVMTVVTYSVPTPTHPRTAVSPRSPLWPGAPPQGPPLTLQI